MNSWSDSSESEPNPCLNQNPVYNICKGKIVIGEDIDIIVIYTD